MAGLRSRAKSGQPTSNSQLNAVPVDCWTAPFLSSDLSEDKVQQTTCINMQNVMLHGSKGAQQMMRRQLDEVAKKKTPNPQSSSSSLGTCKHAGIYAPRNPSSEPPTPCPWQWELLCTGLELESMQNWAWAVKYDGVSAC